MIWFKTRKWFVKCSVQSHWLNPTTELISFEPWIKNKSSLPKYVSLCYLYQVIYLLQHQWVVIIFRTSGSNKVLTNTVSVMPHWCFSVNSKFQESCILFASCCVSCVSISIDSMYICWVYWIGNRAIIWHSRIGTMQVKQKSVTLKEGPWKV